MKRKTETTIYTFFVAVAKNVAIRTVGNVRTVRIAPIKLIGFLLISKSKRTALHKRYNIVTTLITAYGIAVVLRMQTRWGNQVQILGKGHYCKAHAKPECPTYSENVFAVNPGDAPSLLRAGVMSVINTFSILLMRPSASAKREVAPEVRLRGFGNPRAPSSFDCFPMRLRAAC